MHDRAVGQGTVGARCMVIADDDVHPRRPGGRDLVDRGDAAVDGDDEGGPALGQALHGGGGQPVAILGPAGQKPADLGAEAAQSPDHDRGGAHAVDVVVAVNDDGTAGGDVAADEIKRPLDPIKGRGIVRLARVKEAPRRGRVSQPAAHEDLGEHVADAELTLKRQRVLGGVGRELQPRNRTASRRRVGGHLQRRTGGARSQRRGGRNRSKCSGLCHRAPM